MKTDYRIIIAAISALVIIQIYAMFKGINGEFRAMIALIIGGLAGYVLPAPKIK